jgi:hypothetical protein
MIQATDFAVYFLFCLGFFLGGYCLALVQKGLTVNIHRGVKQDKLEEYESTLEHLDPQVRQYYESNNGLNKF